LSYAFSPGVREPRAVRGEGRSSLIGTSAHYKPASVDMLLCSHSGCLLAEGVDVRAGGSETHPYKDGAGRGGFPMATFQGIITL